MWIQPPAAKASQKSPAPSTATTPATSKQSVQNKEPSQTEEPAGYVTIHRNVSVLSSPPFLFDTRSITIMSCGIKFSIFFFKSQQKQSKMKQNQ